MKRSSLAWVLLVSAATAGGAVELSACSSDTNNTTTSGGNDAGGKKDGTAGDDGGSTNKDGGGTPNDGGDLDAGGGGDCGKAPSLHPRPNDDAGNPLQNFLCPFSASGQDPWKYCSSGTEHCCVPFAKGVLSTCESNGCPDQPDAAPFDGRDIACLDAVDCNSGQKCCATGTVETDQVCGTHFGKGFNGAHCADSCDTGAGEYAICNSQDECGSGKTCTPLKVVGVQYGACL